MYFDVELHLLGRLYTLRFNDLVTVEHLEEIVLRDFPETKQFRVDYDVKFLYKGHPVHHHRQEFLYKIVRGDTRPVVFVEFSESFSAQSDGMNEAVRKEMSSFSESSIDELL